MKRIKYSKFDESDLGLSAEDLMRMLGDLLLDSGYSGFNELTMEELREALKKALEERQEYSQAQIDQALEGLLAKLEEEGYLNTEQQRDRVTVNVTDKAVDFLGFKTLKDLLGGLGRASMGAHDTRELATGVETSGASKQWEFGDTLNLDASATLFSAMRREGVEVPLNIEYSDLHVHQSDYQSSCATVVMLDCSHSMILYGEDRFTPAKRVALALAHLIRTQYPGDTLRFVLFHDTAEEVRLGDLARVQVGPYYTNTRDGLILAQKILTSERKDMKQIVMITDGKPSALTLDDGRIYKNPMGLDPLVMSKTLEEVGRCKRAGIPINTFMLATDYALVQFVQQMTEMCKGKAYFTTPHTLGQYVMMDFLSRKSKTVH